MKIWAWEGLGEPRYGNLKVEAKTRKGLQKCHRQNGSNMEGNVCNLVTTYAVDLKQYLPRISDFHSTPCTKQIDQTIINSEGSWRDETVPIWCCKVLSILHCHLHN